MASTELLKALEIAGQDTNTPAIRLTPSYFTNFYLLVYRLGLSANAVKAFYYEGDLSAAKKRAARYCKIKGYKMVQVTSFITDFEIEEMLEPEAKTLQELEGEIRI